MDNQIKTSEAIKIRYITEDAQRLRAEAKAAGCSLSELIRERSLRADMEAELLKIRIQKISAQLYGRKQVRVYRAVDMPDAVDHLTEPLVLFAQIGKRLFSVCEIHPVTSLRFAILLYNSEVCNAIRKYGEAAFDARKKLVCIFCLFLLCFMYRAVYAVFFT